MTGAWTDHATADAVGAVSTSSRREVEITLSIVYCLPEISMVVPGAHAVLKPVPESRTTGPTTLAVPETAVPIVGQSWKFIFPSEALAATTSSDSVSCRTDPPTTFSAVPT